MAWYSGVILYFPYHTHIAKNHYPGDESDELDLLTYHKLILLIAVLVQYYFYQAVVFFIERGT